jgi:hypothetical protein
MSRTLQILVASVVAVILAAVPTPAHAQSIIKSPGDHPPYKVELEPHLALGWGHLYRGNGLGVGARVGIVIVDNGFVKSINNSVAISFGADWLRYSGCYYYDGRARFEYGCGASYFVFPVTMQWNFWLTPRWSVFGEPGLYFYHGIYDDYCRDRNNNVVPGCGYPTRGGADLAFYVGGRFHFTDTIALTMRLGYPSSSVGVSFLF